MKFSAALSIITLILIGAVWVFLTTRPAAPISRHAYARRLPSTSSDPKAPEEPKAITVEPTPVIPLGSEIPKKIQPLTWVDAEGKTLTGLVTREAARNLGASSPEALIQTFYWAAVQGDLDACRNLISISEFGVDAGGTPLTVQRYFETLPASTRDKAQSPEGIVGITVQHDLANFDAMQIMSRENLSPNSVIVVARFLGADGSSREHTWVLKKTSEGWRRSVWIAEFDRAAQRLTGTKRLP